MRDSPNMAFRGFLKRLWASVMVVMFIQHNVDADDQLVAQLSTASSSFSQRLYKQLASSKPNLIYSPYSIHSALSMTSTGARGETLKEMKNVLGLNAMSDTDVRTAYHNLIALLNSAQTVKLDTANAIFANPSYKIKDEFINEIGAKYFATATNFDLNAQNGPETPINDYVSLKTHKMITNVLAPGTIDASTLMILINTIFFNGTWATPFQKYSTRKENFFQLGNATTKVDMMHGEGHFLYKRDLNRKLDIVELPFKGYRFGLYVALPHDIEGISQLESSLANGVDDLFKNMMGTTLTVAIPKFKVESSINLKRILIDMGMKRAFGIGHSNFTGIIESATLRIDDVIHKAVIDVTESGTTAAAVTTISIVAEAVLMTQQRFIADHPFIFFLKDKQTGQILFQGKFSA